MPINPVQFNFSEADLRAMLEDATSLEEQGHGTFIIGTTSQGVR